MSKKCGRILLILSCVAFFSLPIHAQSDWDRLEPATPARIWRVNDTRRLTTVAFSPTSYDEMTRISVSL